MTIYYRIILPPRQLIIRFPQEPGASTPQPTPYIPKLDDLNYVSVPSRNLTSSDIITDKHYNNRGFKNRQKPFGRK
jgi:hypothetical protein